jgi:hypothetical protein
MTQLKVQSSRKLGYSCDYWSVKTDARHTMTPLFHVIPNLPLVIPNEREGSVWNATIRTA